LRFIKLETEIEEFPDGLSIEFNENINILHIETKSRFERIKNIISEFSLKLFSSEAGNSGGVLNFTLFASYSGKTYILDSNGRTTPAPEPEGENLIDSGSGEIKKTPLDLYLEKICRENFYLFSSLEAGEIEDNSFQILPEVYRNILVNIDMLKESDSLPDEEEASLEKTKALSALTKQKELIEIKKMRKDKLQKEISAINRVLGRLTKKLKTLNDFRSTLNNISEKITVKNQLASKINNSKKNVLESRDLRNRLNDLGKELKAEFPQFKNYGENLPSLENVESIFNDLKDINEKIDRHKLRTEQIRGRSWKAIGAINIFSITAIIFLAIKGANFPIPVIAAAALLFSGAAHFFSSLKLKRNDMESLLEEKKTYQLKLSAALESEHFKFDNYQTEELYEFLLQYFDDFIRYSELQGEIKNLESNISSLPPLKETEKKLDSRSQEMVRIEKEIIRKMQSLDPEIIKVEQEEEIENALFEINELIAAIEDEIKQEDSIRKKIENEIIDYDRKDNSGISYDHQLAEITKQIKNLEDDKKALSFIRELTPHASLVWATEKLALMAEKTWETVEHLSEKTGFDLPPEYKDRIIHLVTKGGSTRQLKGVPDNCIKIALIHALEKISEASWLMPPLIIVLTSDEGDNNSFIKNVLELFTERQVIIIASAPIHGISGNLISI